jgi:hypothetical protein
MFKSLPATQLRCLGLTQRLYQLGLKYFQTREVFGGLYQAVSQGGSLYLRCLN